MPGGKLAVEANGLDGDGPAQLRIPAAEDRAHGTRADHVLDLVAAQEDLVQALLFGEPPLEGLEGGPQLADLVAARRRRQAGQAPLGPGQLADRPDDRNPGNHRQQADEEDGAADGEDRLALHPPGDALGDRQRLP